MCTEAEKCGTNVAVRAAERIVGAQGKYKKWGPYYGLCEGDLRARPQEILRV